MFKILPTALFRKSVTSLAASLTFLPRMRNFKGIFEMTYRKKRRKKKERKTRQNKLIYEILRDERCSVRSP